MIRLSSIINTFEAGLLDQYGPRLLPGHQRALRAMKHCRTAMSPHMQLQCTQWIATDWCHTPAAIATARTVNTTKASNPGNGKRQARTALVTVRAATVTLKAPRRRGRAKHSDSMEPITLNVIAASEEHSPEGQEPISWVLLTNLAVNSFSQDCEKIGWYAKR